MKKLYFKDVIRHLDNLCKVRLYEVTNEKSSCEYEGYIIDIPWTWLDYTIASDENGEGIGIETDSKNGEVYFAIYLEPEE